MKVAIYPGSFDPITNGHLDVLNRALKIFDKVIVLVAVNPKKKSRFSPEERVQMIKEAVDGNVEVEAFAGLTVEYAKAHGATHLIRGLRAVTDFEYEFQLASANDFVDSNIDTVFLMHGGIWSVFDARAGGIQVQPRGPGLPESSGAHGARSRVRSAVLFLRPLSGRAPGSL